MMQKGFDVVNFHGTASGVIATPYIGENNNWWIGNEDTGISAKGLKGDQGQTGVQGPKGNQGDAGPAGPQGAQGASGSQGLKGDQGDIGPAGPQGIQGLKGDQGIQGETGPVGPQGAKGQDADVAELEKLKEDVVQINNDLGDLTTIKDSGVTTCSLGSLINTCKFNKTFAKPPMVICQCSAGTDGYVVVNVRNITTTDFSYTNRWDGGTTNAAKATIYWIAF